MEDNITSDNIQEAFSSLVEITSVYADTLTYWEWLNLLDFLEESKTNAWTHVDPIFLSIIGGRKKLKDKNFGKDGLEIFLLNHSLLYFQNVLSRIGQGVLIPFKEIPTRIQDVDKVIKNIITYRLRVGKCFQKS